MSLLDMINFRLESLITVLTKLIPQEVRFATQKLSENPRSISEEKDK
jgi:hypothetical protein